MLEEIFGILLQCLEPSPGMILSCAHLIVPRVTFFSPSSLPATKSDLQPLFVGKIMHLNLNNITDTKLFNCARIPLNHHEIKIL